MTYDDFSFEKLSEIPVANWNKIDKNEYNSVIIVPMNELHESGFKCMTYLFCKGQEIICRSEGCSDVLHLDGIGGYGQWDPAKDLPIALPPRAWSIDCLPNGYLRLFCSNGKIINGNGLSDYAIFAEIKPRKNKE